MRPYGFGALVLLRQDVFTLWDGAVLARTRFSIIKNDYVLAIVLRCLVSALIAATFRCRSCNRLLKPNRDNNGPI